ncbi:uncharacterized protein K452DRAFT_49345 [Aplosporella prunicola CBS 121167]|uniref:Uncharacterized protein n=1 Tax=Aplosporella prunicola CBS 121167 TaxID=1176127 RepID=A0A6A6B9D8_9PEZI|nr:uncharacterized protein K452DRAFT_49345 [Aplosporella prunicola CBS 121167]KAF2140636.1 hypothetical protein K452DRAFT_49345 [Aplosporella prunicola CBS 121167]
MNGPRRIMSSTAVGRRGSERMVCLSRPTKNENCRPAKQTSKSVSRATGLKSGSSSGGGGSEHTYSLGAITKARRRRIVGNYAIHPERRRYLFSFFDQPDSMSGRWWVGSSRGYGKPRPASQPRKPRQMRQREVGVSARIRAVHPSRHAFKVNQSFLAPRSRHKPAARARPRFKRTRALGVRVCMGVGALSTYFSTPWLDRRCGYALRCVALPCLPHAHVHAHALALALALVLVLVLALAHVHVHAHARSWPCRPASVRSEIRNRRLWRGCFVCGSIRSRGGRRLGPALACPGLLSNTLSQRHGVGTCLVTS